MKLLDSKVHEGKSRRTLHTQLNLAIDRWSGLPGIYSKCYLSHSLCVGTFNHFPVSKPDWEDDWMVLYNRILTDWKFAWLSVAVVLNLKLRFFLVKNDQANWNVLLGWWSSTNITFLALIWNFVWFGQNIASKSKKIFEDVFVQQAHVILYQN